VKRLSSPTEARIGCASNRRNNARRWLLLVLFALYGSMMTALAQSSMSDDQIADYVIEENAKGTSRQEIVMKLMQRGVTIEQVRRIYKKYQRQMKEQGLNAEDITAGTKGAKTRLREANGDQKKTKKDEEREKRDKRNVSKFRLKDTKKKTTKHTYDEDDKEFTEMDDAMDFMMPDSLKYNFEKDKYGEKKPKRKQVWA